MKRILKSKLLISVLTVLVTAGLIFSVISVCRAYFPSFGFGGFVPAPYGGGMSEKVKIAQGLEIPDWVDEEIITVHSTARTGAQLKDIKNIVVHYVGNAGSSAINNRHYFNKLTTTVSSHFVVGLQGEIIQCLPLWEKSAASNNRNGDTVSIEVCHPDNSGEFSDVTYNSLVKLCSWLCENLGLDENTIIRHYDITGKNCPKYYVENPEEWKSFLGEVGEDVKNKESR